MNLAFYVLVFDRGTDAWLDLAGLGRRYREQSGHSVFAAESHILYRREVRLGDPLLVRTRLAAADGKRLHLLHEMTSGDAAIAMQEVLFVHVDLATRRAAALDVTAASRLAGLALAGPLPDWAGRRVGLARRQPGRPG